MLKGFTKPLTKKGILYKLCGLWLVFHLDKSGSDDIDKLENVGIKTFTVSTKLAIPIQLYKSVCVIRGK